MKKVLALLLFIIVSFLAVVGGVIFYYYDDPLRAWPYLENTVLPNDLEVRWDNGRIGLNHKKNLTWQIQIDFSGLRIEKKSPQISASNVRLNADLELSLFLPRTFLTVRSLILSSPDVVRLQTSEAGEPAAQSSPKTSISQAVQNLLSQVGTAKKYLKVQDAKIEFPDIKIISGSSVNLLSVQIAKGEDYGVFLGAFKVKAGGFSGDIPLRLVIGEEDFKIYSRSEIEFLQGKSAYILRPDLSLTIGSSEISLSATLDAEGLPVVKRLDQIQLAAQIPLLSTGLGVSKAEIAVPLPRHFINRCRCGLKKDLMFRASSDIDWDPFTIRTRFSIDSIQTPAFDLDLAATLDLTEKKQGGWEISPTLDSVGAIKDFQKVAQILRSFRVLLPAPLHVLDGKVDFEAKSPVELQMTESTWTGLSASFKVTTDLRSAEQRLQTGFQTFVFATSDFSKVHFDIDATIDSLRLEVPPIEPIGGIPKIIKDGRLVVEPPKKKVSTQVTFSFGVETTSPGAIQLLYPHAKPHVPLSIRFQRSPRRGSEGYLQIEPFTIEYLRRKVLLESLRLSLDEKDDGSFPIDARLSVQQTEYKVMIRVTGTTVQPHIELTSEPYLETADIVSVLLFDRPRDQLVGGDAETAGNVQAAVADRAIGLFGIWAFAATPIRSFSYNSVTKVYSATIVLDEGLTAGIGTSLDQYTSLELRKRLSRRWVLAAAYIPSNDGSETGQVVLQWERRF